MEQRAQRGVPQHLPADADTITGLESRLLHLFRTHGYRRAISPTYEPVELYETIYGRQIRGRLLTFTSDREYALRPDLTAGICRTLASELDGVPASPLRLSAAGSAFRHERIRPLRLREFSQVGVERVGDSDETLCGADLEIVSLARLALLECGIDQGVLRLGHAGLHTELLNALGFHGKDRRRAAALLDTLTRVKERFSHQGADKHGDADYFLWETRKEARRALGLDADTPLEGGDSPQRLIDDVIEVFEPVARAAELTPSHYEALLALTDTMGTFEVFEERVAALDLPIEISVLRHFAQVEQDLAPLEVHYAPFAARGLGYYTGFTFEIDVPCLGPDVSQVVGGGRYDRLMNALGAASMGAAGFAVGLERLFAAAVKIQTRGRIDFLVVDQEPTLLGFGQGEHDQDAIADLGDRLRSEGLAMVYHPTALPVTENGILPTFLSELRALPGSPYAQLVVAHEGLFFLADIESGRQQELTRGAIVAALTRE